ncbi:hypothetical protein Dimus_032038 [Dionaea muscipula]
MLSGISCLRSQLLEDFVVEILVRLPVKSLIRFKCVCKRWLSLIGSDHFAAKQLAAARSSDDDDHYGPFDCFLSNFRQIFNGELEFTLNSLDTHSCRRFKITLHPSFSPGRSMWVAVAGPLDGILCLKNTFVLWNPTTGEVRPIPPLTKCFEFFGLGRDPRTGDCKILAISIYRTRSGDISNQMSIKAEVYSLGSSSWRVLDVNGRMLSMLGTHTLLGNNGSDNVASFVLSFDLSDQIYIETPLPPSDHCMKSECLLRHCPNHGATCALFFVSGQRFNGCVRPIEIWVLIGCNARSSWTKQIIFLDCNLNRADWVYYKESLVSIP